jgi:hypothetical protein
MAFKASFFDRAPVKTVAEQALSAMHSGTGFSLIRLGDGEGPILCWPELQLPGQIEAVLQIWFGNAIPNLNDLQVIADGLRRSVRSADVLGLPTHYQMTRSERYGMVLQGLERHHLCSPSQLFGDSGLHFYLQWSGALAYLLRDLDSVNVIGCRDIGPQIAEAFKLKSVRTYLVRGENHFPGSVSIPHWPDGFHRVMEQLETVPAGAVFLVGAGILGKIYCDRIKSKNGIALDIGSILDSWANVPSRECFGPPAYTLNHFKTARTNWDQMAASLRKCAGELHARDKTITL